MSLTDARIKTSLKDQLLEEERALKAELEAVVKAVPRASKTKIKKGKD